MSLVGRLAHRTLTTAYTPALRRLVGTADLAGSQDRLLAAIIAANHDSAFGRRHRFAAIKSVSDYRRAVPLSRWDDYASDVEQIAAGVPGVLTTEPVRLLEPSSGSTAAVKLIPYTATLARQFRAGLQPWLADLYRHHPGLRRGRSYWSVTPAASGSTQFAGTRAGEQPIPIGFDDDADYLGPLAARLLGTVLAVDPRAVRAATMDEFRRRTALALLAAPDLALVSVWSPTFLLVLLDWIAAHATTLVPQLPAARREPVAEALAGRDWPAIWPDLELISCWADAHAADPARRLAALFPSATMQAKGLLATEAIVSIPLVSAGGAVLAARSHHFEFLAGTEVSGAHEVDVGGVYEVVVTTGGGLYRYRLGDLIEVTGRFGGLPVLRFVGRADKVCDLVGEKLSEAFVARCLASLALDGFTMLAPGQSASAHYVLYAERSGADSASRLDTALRASPHYDHARRLGQLGAPRVVPVGPDAAQRYLAACVARGQRLGDVKPAALALTADWDHLAR